MIKRFKEKLKLSVIKGIMIRLSFILLICKVLSSFTCNSYSIKSLNFNDGSFEDFLKTNIHSNIDKNKRITKAYGYLYAQNYQLNYIKNNYPNYRSACVRAQIEFDVVFEDSKIRIKKYLLELFGESGLKELDDYLKTFSDDLYVQKYTDEEINNILLELKRREQGEIESPVLETLLHFKFVDNPGSEFGTDFITVFKTLGHPKSKNTDWQIKIPKSWKAQEGNRPNIIQKFTSDYGDGNVSVMMMAVKMEESMSKLDCEKYFSEANMKTSLPNESNFISFKKMIFDGVSGSALEYETINRRLDHEIKIRSVQYMFIVADKIYTVSCQIAATDIATNLQVEFNKYLFLFRQIANSIVVNDQY